MRRRYWSFLLAFAAILVFASYIGYTQYLTREIRQQAEVSSRIYSLVQRGLVAEDQELASLLDIQLRLDSLGLPIILLNGGQPVAGTNLGFAPEFDSEAGRQALLDHAAALVKRHPENRVDEGTLTVIFGDPPLLAWLRWVPALQIAGGMLLLVVALAVIRADLRAERERLWAAMARETAHQMGTPLSSLSGWVEVLALPHAEREAFADDAHIATVMAADVERLERVSRRFELIGKPQPLDAVPVADVVIELESYFRPRLPKFGKGITFRSRVERGLPSVRGNRVLLVWAVENVVKNAIDALGGRGGHILLVAHRGQDSVHLKIADDGPGVPAAIRDRIFEPGVSSKEGGWGVGLSLTRRIVHDLHHGQVAVRARRRGGTVFDIILPVTA
jgi:signal transduction histidine kinase